MPRSRSTSSHEDDMFQTANPSERMNQTVGNTATSKFLQTLGRKPKNEDTVKRYNALYGVAQQFHGMQEREKEATEEGLGIDGTNMAGANMAFVLSKREGENTRKFFQKMKEMHLDDLPEMNQNKQDLYKEVYMPMIASALGVNQLPLSARVDIYSQTRNRGGRPMRYQGTMNEMIEGRNLEEVYRDNDINALNKIDPVQLQKLMVFDMLFENQDAHFKQYILSNDNNLYKIDNEDYLMEEENKEAKAGSFLAGLPIANRQMTEEVLDMIIDWDPEYIKELMSSAAIDMDVEGGKKQRQDFFSEQQIERVMSNLNDLKELADEAKISGLSARELFELYNARDESGKMTANLLPKPANMRPAQFANKFGTRLHLDRTPFRTLDQSESTEANRLAETRGELNMDNIRNRMDFYYNLPEKARSYREMRSLRRQAMTPRLEQERLEEFHRRYFRNQ